MKRQQLLAVFMFLGIFALCAHAIKNHGDHAHIFLQNEHIHAPSAKHFHEVQHPNMAESQKTLEERLDDPLVHTFLVHFASKDDMHLYAQQTIHEDPDVIYEGYVAQGGFIVHITHQKALELANKSFIDWVGYYKPEHKVHSSIGEETVSKTVVVDLIHSFSKEEINQMVAGWIASNEEFQQQVVIEGGDNSQRILLKVKSGSEALFGRFAEFLSHQRQVHSVSRKQIMKIDNKWSKSIVQFGSEVPVLNEDLPYWKLGLTGDGQVVGIGDTGIDFRSCFWAEEESVSPNLPPFYTWVENPTQEDMFRQEDQFRRKIVQYVVGTDFGDELDSNGHGTHVAGSVAGYPVNDALEFYRNASGAARDAKIAFFDIEGDPAFGLRMPPSLVQGYFPWAYAAGARIHSNSFGSDSANYEYSSREFDDYMFQNKDFVSLVAAGNSGTCASQRATIGTPASAKNVITVGASINSNEMWGSQVSTYEWFAYSKKGAVYGKDSMASFSSQGPSGDGRIKPDVSAPGFFILSSVHGQEQGSFCDEANTGLSTGFMAGTSMATPTLAGNLAILRQYFLDGYYPTGQFAPVDGFIPSGSLMKAATINGAVQMMGQKVSSTTKTLQTANQPTQTACEAANAIVDLPARPNVLEGYGRFQLDQVAYVASMNQDSFLFIPSQNLGNSDIFSDSRISGGEVHAFDFCSFENIADREIRITLVWTDPAGALGADFALVNDLDLIVTYRGETIYGNTQSGVLSISDEFLRNSKGITTTVDRDSINPVEGVYLSPASPQEGKLDLHIEVHGVSVPQGPQPYSLVVTGFLAQGLCSDVTRAGPPDRNMPPVAGRSSLALPLGLAAGATVIAGAAAVVIYKKKKQSNGAFIGQKQDNVKLLGNAL